MSTQVQRKHHKTAYNFGLLVCPIIVLIVSIEAHNEATRSHSVTSSSVSSSSSGSGVGSSSSSGASSTIANNKEEISYYEYRHTVAEGVQKALDTCREKFKWERWNCPKKAFLDILDKNPVPSNKEYGLTRALIASGIVLSLTKSCSYGTSNVCGCSHTTTTTASSSSSIATAAAGINPIISTQQQSTTNDNTASSTTTDETDHFLSNLDPNSSSDFMWRGCDESIKFAFKVSKIYLESQDVQHDDTSRRINAHNYEVGRHAVKKNMGKVCKCHGVSGTCQLQTCWLTVPDMSKVGSYIKRQYRLAAKVGAMSTEETNLSTLNKELSNINQDKLVFADASPDYCYENAIFGINGTLGRYCSKAKHRPDGSLVSRSERDSCDRLCTKCGYKIKRERLNTEKQCDCRFVYCCSVECKRCPHVEDTFKCVRHS